MVINVIALLALFAGLYIVQQADKQKKQEPKAVYALAGLVTLIWAVSMLFNGFVMRTSSMPLVFGMTTIGAMKSKGLTQAVFGAIALIIVLVMIG